MNRPAGLAARSGEVPAQPPLSALVVANPYAVAQDLCDGKVTFEACREAVARLPRAQRDACLTTLAEVMVPTAQCGRPRGFVLAQRLLNARTNPPNEALGSCAQGSNPVAAEMFTALRSSSKRAQLEATLAGQGLQPPEEAALQQLLHDADQYDREQHARRLRNKKVNIKLVACAGGLAALGLAFVIIPFVSVPLLVAAVGVGLYAWKGNDALAALHLRGYFNTP